MKKTSLPTAVAVAFAAASILLAPPAAAASGPLAGTWVSEDTDGSSQTLTISGSGRRVYAMTYFDDSATSACGGNPALVSGPGRINGDQIVQSGPLVCLPGGNVVRSRITINYEYDAGKDLLVDQFGIEWRRAA